MRCSDRRRFLALLTGASGALSGAIAVDAQAPPRVSMDEAGDRRRRLGAALRALNETAGLGVTPDELERAEAYATAAIVETQAKLRPIELGDGLDLPVVFRARRRS